MSRIKQTILQKHFICIILCFFTTPLFCQVVISGKIQNEQGVGIPNASITLTEKGTSNIISFAISDNKGLFSIKNSSSANQLVINVKKINYEFVSQTIANETRSFDFVLIPKITELKEVIVKTTPIRKRGDTLSYNVNSFADQKDRTIADIIAKLPGIDIQSDGKIYYQGKPIQKYYINGMDLLEGKYNLANNNLPYQSVTSVQILENHQPIRILDSLVPSERASLNIKLKNDITVTGSLKAGIGVSPLLWDLNLTPMLFKKNQQFIASYQANNAGSDLSKEIKTLTIDNLIDQLENSTDKKDLSAIIALKTPPVATKRYLDNNSHLLTANLLTKLKRDVELRFNVSYLNDNLKQNGVTTTEYFLPGGNVGFRESMQNNYFTGELRGDITLQKNTPKAYFKNSLTIKYDRNSDRGVIFNNNTHIRQVLNNPYFSAANQFKWITSIGKQLVTFFSFVNYNRGPQNLTVTPGQFIQVLNNNLPFEVLQQNTAQNIFQTNNYIEFTKGIKKITLTGKAGFKLQTQRTNTQMLKEGTPLEEDFNNNTNCNFFKAFATTGIIYKAQSYQLAIQLPLSWYNIAVSDKVLLQEQKKNVLVLDPLLSLNYDINNYWRINSHILYNNNFQDYNRILYGYLLQNYRTLIRNYFPIAQNKLIDFSNGLYYKSALKSLFFNINNQVTLTKRPFMLEPTVNPNGTQQIKVIPLVNEVASYNTRLDISRYYYKIKTTFAFNFEYGVTIGKQILAGRPAKTTNRTYKPGFKGDTRLSTSVSLDYRIGANFNRNSVEGSEGQSVFSLNDLLKVSIYPTSNQYIGFTAEHYYNDFSSSGKHIVYADIIWRYTIKKRKIDIECSATNLFNKQQYVTANFTDFSFLQSSFNIRPRQLLATIRMQL